MTYMKPAVTEELRVRGFALQLYDGFTGQPQLEGEMSVTIAGKRPPLEKTDSSTFVFIDIAPGDYSISVRSLDRTPYYLPVVVPVTLPMPDPLWQAYPDLSVADRSKPLDDPTQPQAYRDQRALALLAPTPHYPFPEGATLLRGAVLAGATPLAGATVIRVGDPVGTASDATGEFVLFFHDVGARGQAATIRAAHPLLAEHLDVQVTLQRGVTVSTRIVL
jgi:hypothetical protein